MNNFVTRHPVLFGSLIALALFAFILVSAAGFLALVLLGGPLG